MTRRDQRARFLSRCIHYNGHFDHRVCLKGVDYDTVKDRSQRPFRWPCFSPEAKTECAKRELTTEADYAAWVQEVEAAIERTTTIRAAIIATGLPAGTIACPCCKTGKVNFTVASSNGHVWAACTTPDCAAWVE